MAIVVYGKKTCSTCRKALADLDARRVGYTFRDIGKVPLSVAEIEGLVGERAIRPFLNTRTELYRSRNMKSATPTKSEFIEWLRKDANLLRRPLLTRGAERLYGYAADAYAALASKG